MTRIEVDEKTGDVVRRPTLKKNKLTRRHRVVAEKVERTKRIDSRFDERRSPIKWKTFHPRNIGVVYLYALIWVVFSLWVVFFDCAMAAVAFRRWRAMTLGLLPARCGPARPLGGRVQGIHRYPAVR